MGRIITVSDLDFIQTLSFNKRLATILGLNEAILLSQIEHLLDLNKRSDEVGDTCEYKKEGYYWVTNSINILAEEFPFWSSCTVKRTLKKLENEGVLITGNFNKYKFDKTKWYRIDYHRLDEIYEEYDKQI